MLGVARGMAGVADEEQRLMTTELKSDTAKPTVDDVESAAKVLRWMALHMIEEKNNWSWWEYFVKSYNPDPYRLLHLSALLEESARNNLEDI